MSASEGTSTVQPPGSSPSSSSRTHPNPQSNTQSQSQIGPIRSRGQHAPRKGARGPSAVACMACRKLKTKCVEGDDESTCQRCKRLQLQCMPPPKVDAPAQSDPNDQIDELKKRVQQLEETLRALGGGRTDNLSGENQSTHVSEHTPTATQGVHRSTLSPSSRTYTTHLSQQDERVSEFSPNELLLSASAPGTLLPSHTPSHTATQTQAQTPTPTPTADISLTSVRSLASTLHPVNWLDTISWDISRQTLLLSIVSDAEARAMLDFYFDKMAILCAVLDSRVHTYDRVLNTCPFLLTVVCALVSVHCQPVGVVKALIRAVNTMTGEILMHGEQSIYIAQAFVLIAVYDYANNPEQVKVDRSWMSLGIAIRMFMALDRESTDSWLLQDNYQRTLLYCFVQDKSFALQHGRPHALVLEIPRLNELARLPRHTDVIALHYSVIIDHVQRSLDDLSEFRQEHTRPSLTVRGVMKTFARQRQQWHADAVSLCSNTDSPLTETNYGHTILFFYESFMAMVVSVAALRAESLSHSSETPYIHASCLSDTLKCLQSVLDPWPWLPYLTDSLLVFIVQACLNLLKLGDPQYAAYLDPQEYRDHLTVITSVINALERAKPPSMTDNSFAMTKYLNLLRWIVAPTAPTNASTAAPATVISQPPIQATQYADDQPVSVEPLIGNSELLASLAMTAGSRASSPTILDRAFLDELWKSYGSLLPDELDGMYQ